MPSYGDWPSKSPITPVVPRQPVVPFSKPPLVTMSAPPPLLTVSMALAEVALLAGDDASLTTALKVAPLSEVCAVSE